VADSRPLKNPAWGEIFHALAKRQGVAVFLGASDTGKTTCLRAAASHLMSLGRLPLAIVDADVGQSTVGPPTTVGLALFRKQSLSTLLSDQLPVHALWFVGAISPVGHMLQALVATKKLVDKASRKGARSLLVDTTGLIAKSAGFQLKLNKLALLQPRHIVAFQREAELEVLLSVLGRQPGLAIHRLRASHSVRPRSPAERYDYRANRFRDYFREAESARLAAGRIAVLSPPYGMLSFIVEPLPSVLDLRSFSAESLKGHLVGLNNVSNETLALGLIEGITRQGQELDVLTPLKDVGRIRIVQMANIRLSKNGEDLDRTESESVSK
jgi:polynucleotide 5'-hydroxyl-kinase GRC3/NOL9